MCSNRTRKILQLVPPLITFESVTTNEQLNVQISVPDQERRVPVESVTTNDQLNVQISVPDRETAVPVESATREELCSPLTIEQQNFFENHENEEDFQYCLRELSRDSPVNISNPEGPPSILRSREGSSSILNSQKNDPYETDGYSDTNWSPSPRVPKNRRLTVISSTSDSSESEVDENINNKIKSRKRLRDQKKWKREIAKRKRLAGEKYVSAVSKTKKIIEKKKIKEACPNTCKLKCFEKISHDNRKKQFESFWKTTNWEQRRQFVASSIDLIPVMRPRGRQNKDISRRKKTRIYNMIINNVRTRVCQKMFLNTFCLTEQFISTTLSKISDATSLVQPDQRGKHIPGNKTPDSVIAGIQNHICMFPRYICHYSREKTTREYLGPDLNITKMYDLYVKKCKEDGIPENMLAKQWLYRKIFNEHFNLSFYLPSNDTCDTCDKFMSLLKHETNPEEREKIEKQRKEHIEDADKRYALKREDKDIAKASEGEKVTLMVDMQKCLATPLLTNSQSFYLRKLWTFNETIHNDTDNKSYCMMWDETQGGRGANEVGSCIIEWVLKYKPENTQEITIWSDNCSGQNRNVILLYCYFWLLQNTGLVTINHKFLLRGHTHSEADVVHSVIERKKKELSNFDIVVPRDWKQFVKICKTTNPLIVHNMNLLNIKDIKALSENFCQRRKNSSHEQFLISQCVWLQVRKHKDGILYYKTSFYDEEFSEINLKKNTRQNLILPSSLPQAHRNIRPISTPKYKDLVTLTQWIADPELKKFYIDLPHGNQPDIIEESENPDLCY